MQAESGGPSMASTQNMMNSSQISNTSQSRSTRERALQAVEYYNSNVLRARMGAGLAGARSSVNERHHIHTRSVHSSGSRLYTGNNPETLYRSNSSLELVHEHNGIHHDSLPHSGTTLRREYGSHGSIDVISSDRPQTTGENFFAMLQDYSPATLMGNNSHQIDHKTNKTEHEDQIDRGNASPKLRMKLHRLWGPAKPLRSQNHVASMEDSSIINISTTSTSSSTSSFITTSSSADIEERQRRRAFAHFDCQSLTANLGYAAKLRGLLLARRRNTTTGASAASMMTRSSTPDAADSGDEDNGDGQCNDLLENCPFFRNEVGGKLFLFFLFLILAS